MRRFDLLDEYQTLFSPALAPQAKPGTGRSGSSRPWPLPVVVLALGVVLALS